MVWLLVSAALAASDPAEERAFARLEPAGPGATLALAVVDRSGTRMTRSAGGGAIRPPLAAADELFVTLAALGLAAEGTLPLQTPVASLDPTLEGAPAWLTVETALDHETGLTETDGQLLLLQQPPTPAGLRWPASSPGARHSFANTVLVGRAVERAAGEPLATVVRRQLAARFGLALSTDATTPGHQLRFGRAASRATPSTGVLLGSAPSLEDLASLASQILRGDLPETASILDHDGNAWHLGFEPRNLDGTPALLWSRTGAVSQAEILLVPRHERAFVVVGDTGGMWPTVQASPATQAARGWLDLDPAPRSELSVPPGTLSTVLALTVAGVLGSFVLRTRRRSHRPQRLVGWVGFTLLRCLELGVVWVLWSATRNNPLGVEGWRLLYRMQGDLGLLMGSLGPVLAGSAVGRILGALFVGRSRPSPPAGGDPPVSGR